MSNDKGKHVDSAGDASAADPAAEVQERVDKELAQGYRGIEVDTTPNGAYSVAGVTSGEPTPETDDAQADKVRADARNIERDANGVAER